MECLRQIKGKAMAIKAVRAGTDDVPLDLQELAKPINDRFKWAVKNIKDKAEQWEQGLVTDDELGWGLRDLELANRDRRALKDAERKLCALAKSYGLRK